MKKLSKETYNRLKTWIYRYARPLDFFWWKCVIEGEGSDAFFEVMSAYQNEDGGIGHAIEPDSWNPNSSPYQSNWWGPEELMEMGIDKNSKIIQGILRYLDNGEYMTEDGWPWAIPSNNYYPHAPWMRYSSENTPGYNITVTSNLIGFIFLFASRDSELFQKGLEITKNLLVKFDGYAEEFFAQGGYDLEGYADLRFAMGGYGTLCKYIEQSGLGDLFDYKKVRERLSFPRDNANEEKELDELIDLIKSDKYLELENPYFCDADKFKNQGSITIYWWKADHIIKDVKRLKRAGRLEEDVKHIHLS